MTPPAAPVPKQIHGKELLSALGLSERAFQRWCQKGHPGLALYPLPGQSRGVFARADELAAFVATQPRLLDHKEVTPRRPK